MSASSRPTLQAVRRKPERQVDGGGRFADAALARGDGDDVLARPAPMRPPRRSAWRGTAAAGVRRGVRGAAWRGGAARSAVSTAVTDSTPGSARPPARGLAQRLERRRRAPARPRSRSRHCRRVTTTPETMPERDDVLPRRGIADRVAERVRGPSLARQPRPCPVLLALLAA